MNGKSRYMGRITGKAYIIHLPVAHQVLHSTKKVRELHGTWIADRIALDGYTARHITGLVAYMAFEPETG